MGRFSTLNPVDTVVRPTGGRFAAIQPVIETQKVLSPSGTSVKSTLPGLARVSDILPSPSEVSANYDKFGLGVDTTAGFESPEIALRKTPLSEVSGIGETVGQGALNLGKGLIRFPNEMILSAIDDPVGFGKGLVTFIPEQVETIVKALGGATASGEGKTLPRTINQRTGLLTSASREQTLEQVTEAREALFQNPEGPIMAALFGRGIVAKLKPKARVSPAEVAPKPIAVEPTPAVRPKLEVAEKQGALGKETKLSIEIEKPVITKPQTITSERVVASKSIRPTDESSIQQLKSYREAISTGRPQIATIPRKDILERAKRENIEPYEARQQLKNERISRVSKEQGIATRVTKAGNITPTVRRSGAFVPSEFAEYRKFKDATQGSLGGTKDPTRFIQEIDGALSVEAKAKIPGQAGPAERLIMWRTRDIQKMKFEFNAEQQIKLKAMTKGISDKQANVANNVLEELTPSMAYMTTEQLAKVPGMKSITQDVNVLRFAQESRKWFDHILRVQNDLRKARGQKLIPVRQKYSPHILREMTVWERAFSWDKTAREILHRPELPDFIKPNKPFNPRELSRQAGLEPFEREMNLKKLLELYANTASRDIFNTSIIENNKAFAQQLRSMKLDNAASGIENWTAESFAGVKGAADRWAALTPMWVKTARRFRRGLVRTVFPLNLLWNVTIQTSSYLLTVTRYGARNSTVGAFNWFTDKSLRRDIHNNAYSAIVKSQGGGRMSRQDVSRGVASAVRLERGKLETATDAANFMTEWTERNLTGASIAAALRDGRQRGLRGKALWEYASDGGAKTQSMYNLEDLPGVLRNEIVKTATPFQTFKFEVWNTMKEFAGKTGTPPATFQQRAKMVLRFTGGALALNTVWGATTGREPWGLSSFIPFYENLISPLESELKGEGFKFTSKRALPAPVGVGLEFTSGVRDIIVKGDWNKMRRWSTRYGTGLFGIPAGTQLDRTIEGMISISQGGARDSAGKLMFSITSDKDKVRAIIMGPFGTSGGREFTDKRRKTLLDMFREQKKRKGGRRKIGSSLK